MIGNTSAQRIVAVCEELWEAHKSDCSGFAKAVATKLGIMLDGLANKIVEDIRSDEWEKLDDGVAAKAAADEGKLVIAGLSGSEQQHPSNHGHVVVVVSGDLARGKYPTAYWGRLGGVGEKAKTLNFAWIEADRDRVSYGAKTIVG